MQNKARRHVGPWKFCRCECMELSVTEVKSKNYIESVSEKIVMQHMFATEMAEQPLFRLRSKTKTIIE